MTKTDIPTISHSQVSLWRECEQRWTYRYGQRLVPKRIERPLHLGSWVHAALEAHYKYGNWRRGHKVYLADYNKLFEEEKLRLDKGKSQKKSMDRADYEPLPSQVERIIRSYIWYYEKNTATRRVEKTIAVEVEYHLPRDGYVQHGVIDRIYEDEDGLKWVQDHKVWDDIPLTEGTLHTVDPQLTIYLEGAKEALGIEAAGVEYNYVRSAAPSFPIQNLDRSLSKKDVATDYPTAFRWLKENGYDPAQYSDLLLPLMGTSPFLRRHRLPRNELVTTRVLEDFDRSATEIVGHDAAVRNIGRHCDWCPYQTICRNELYGMSTKALRDMNFEIEDKSKRKKVV